VRVSTVLVTYQQEAAPVHNVFLVLQLASGTASVSSTQSAVVQPVRGAHGNRTNTCPVLWHQLALRYKSPDVIWPLARLVSAKLGPG
jgi:hypothetical protein